MTHKIVDKETKGEGGFELSKRKRDKIKAYLADWVKSRNFQLIPEHAALLTKKD